MNAYLIKNARIIDPSGESDKCGDILIKDGFIQTVGQNIRCEDAVIINADGLVAAPGLVDMHVHTRDPGFTHKEDILSVGESAAAGGVTTIAAMPNTNPPADNAQTIQYVLEHSKRCKVKVLPVARITDRTGGALTDFESLVKAGAVAFSDDGEPVPTAKLMSDALKKSSWLGMNILAHCEDKSLSEGGLINEGMVSEALGVGGIPTSAEDVGTSREIALANALDARIHICHVSSASALEFIKSAKQSGAKITCETCPHYFSLNEELLFHQDADYRMNPPLRPDYDKRAVLRGIIDGTIDVIATDHAPHTALEKKSFFDAPNGVIGLETSLAAGITYLVKPGYISLFKLIYMMSTVPAQILGTKSGSLKTGSPADIVLFDENERWIVDTDKLHGKSKNTAFKDMELYGKVKYTFCRGEIVYKDS